jgi:hypothetical protein
MIHVVHDAVSMTLTARPLVQSPPVYDGTIDAFISQYVLPDLPSPDTVAAFHDELRQYINGGDPLFLLRAVNGTVRREVYKTSDGTRFRASDNAPAWWVHAMVVQNYRIAPGAFGDVVATMPTHMFDVAAVTGRTANAAGWHIAHIFDVKDGNTDYKRWSRAEVIGRFVRNIHPCNYFPIAKAEWRRWGGDQRVIATFAALYAERYNEVWADFLRLSRVREDALLPIGEPVRYYYGTEVSAERSRHRRAPVAIMRNRVQGGGSGSDGATVTYQASRLTFKRDVIEPLDESDSFQVVTPDGTFRMTKAEFYSTFPNVPLTKSYRQTGVYNYATLPRAAERFRL